MTNTTDPDFSAMEELWERKPTNDLGGLLSKDVGRIEVIHFTYRIRIQIDLDNEEGVRTYHFNRVDCAIHFSDQVGTLAVAVYETMHTHPHTHLRPYLSGYPGWVWWRYLPDGFEESS